MNKIIKNKIGLPDWLKELIEKGKYSDLDLAQSNRGNIVKLIENNSILKKKVNMEAKYKITNMKQVQKVLNGKLFIFDPISKIVITEIKND